MELGIIVDDLIKCEKCLNKKKLTVKNGFSDYEILMNKSIKYLYFGHEFCQYKLPRLSDVIKAIDYSHNSDLEFVLVTPPLTDYGCKICSTYLDYFIENKIESEIVINDIGMIDLIKRKHYSGKITFGRVLEKSIHEMRLTDLEETNYYSSEGYVYMHSLAFQASSFSDFFNEYGVSRIEYDGDKYIKNINSSKIKIDYIYPTEYLTTGRMCLFRIAAQKDDERFLLNDSCSRLCNEHYEIMNKMMSYFKLDSNGNRIREENILRKGNTLFSIDKTLKINQNADRLIVDISNIYDTIFY